MGFSGERIKYFSQLEVPIVFKKEPPCDFVCVQSSESTRQEDEAGCGAADAVAPVGEISDCIKGKVAFEEQECTSAIWQTTQDSEDIANKFAPHQMALARCQENLKTFLEMKAREIDRATDPKVREMEAIQRDVRLEIEKERLRERNESYRCATKRIVLPQLFFRSFFNEILFRRIEVIECEDLEQLRTAIITSQDAIQFLEECLLNYNKWDIETDRKIVILVEELTVKENEVSELLQASEFFKDGLLIEDQLHYISPESRISFLLGLEIDFLDRLETFDEDIRYHKITEEWIQIFLENKFEEIEDESLKLNLNKELLVKIGFRPNSRAVKTLVSRSERMTHHNDPLSSVQRFVRDEFKYNSLLSGRDRYERIESVCYELPSCESSSKTISVFDVASECGVSQEVISAHMSELRDDDHVVLYHGTDRVSAVDIYSGGIDVNMGLPKRDFSDGIGFYLTNDFEHAKKWAFSQTSKPAILAFKLPKPFLAEAQSLNLATSENTDYWRDIVRAFRAGKPSKTMRKNLRKYDCIEGSVSLPCDDVTDRTADCEISRVPKPNSYQLCITSEDFADEINTHLQTIALYN